ncbi:hypothetical protein ACIBG8_42890 [Nonomuraea sp. NPDC050556]
MRYVVDIYYTTDGMHGEVTTEGDPTPVPFHGWLDLLRLLEPAEP